MSENKDNLLIKQKAGDADKKLLEKEKDDSLNLIKSLWTQRPDDTLSKLTGSKSRADSKPTPYVGATKFTTADDSHSYVFSASDVQLDAASDERGIFTGEISYNEETIRNSFSQTESPNDETTKLSDSSLVCSSSNFAFDHKHNDNRGSPDDMKTSNITSQNNVSETEQVNRLTTMKIEKFKRTTNITIITTKEIAAKQLFKGRKTNNSQKKSRSLEPEIQNTGLQTSPEKVCSKCKGIVMADKITTKTLEANIKQKTQRAVKPTIKKADFQTLPENVCKTCKGIKMTDGGLNGETKKDDKRWNRANHSSFNRRTHTAPTTNHGNKADRNDKPYDILRINTDSEDFGKCLDEKAQNQHNRTNLNKRYSGAEADDETPEVIHSLIGGDLDREKSRESSQGYSSTETRTKSGLINANMLMLTLAESAGFEIHDVAADGNCMFRSIVDQLWMQGEFQQTAVGLRRKTVQYLRENPLHQDGTHLQEFLPSENWETYLQRMQLDGEWGDQIMLKGIAEVTGRKICIISAFGDLHNQTTIEPSKAEADQSENIFLGHIDDFHYVSLRSKDWLQKWFVSARNTMQKEENIQSSSPNSKRMSGAQNLPHTNEVVDSVSNESLFHFTYIVRNVLNAKYFRTEEETRTAIMKFLSAISKGIKYVVAGNLVERFSVSLSNPLQLPINYNHNGNKQLMTQEKEAATLYQVSVLHNIVVDIADATANTEFIACVSDVHPGYLRLQSLFPHFRQKQISWVKGHIPCLNKAPFQTKVNSYWRDFISKCKCQLDIFKIIKCPNFAFLMDSWPKSALKWTSRERQSGWPDEHLQQEVVNKGCLVVPISHPSSEHPECEWKLIFAESEAILALNISKYQRHCFHIFKVLVEFYAADIDLSAEVLKTVFFYVCETIPRQQWKDSPGICVLNLLDMLLNCIKTQNMPHYFIPENNIIDHFSPEETSILLSRLEVVRKFPMVSCVLLSEYNGLRSASLADPILEDLVNRFKEHEDLLRSVNEVMIPQLIYLATIELRQEFYDQSINTVKEAHELLSYAQSLQCRDNNVMPLKNFIQYFLGSEPLVPKFWFCFFMDYYHDTDCTTDLAFSGDTKTIKEIADNQESGKFDDILVPILVLHQPNVPQTMPNIENILFMRQLSRNLYFQAISNEPRLYDDCAHYMRCTIKMIKDAIDGLISNTNDDDGKTYSEEKSGYATNTPTSEKYKKHYTLSCYNDHLALAMYDLYNCYLKSGRVELFQEYIEEFAEVCEKVALLGIRETLATMWYNLGNKDKAKEALDQK